ncbi:hypothetical protein CRE_18270 [Caenorhabditis remanei]|uniref:Uncharacterized protein n=1 Tax=Caenorhabditis remanei TaxID=31234 RepID=E3NIW7_CAERE|nr:hypothetical protein CRE_18270 [Caenorhabditis remanei]
MSQRSVVIPTDSNLPPSTAAHLHGKYYYVSYTTCEIKGISQHDLIDVGLSTQGNRYILSIIDLFTKYGIGVPIPDKKGVTVLKAFIERWAIGEGRVPEVLLTDQGKEFCNEHFQKFAELVQMKHITTKGYNSRANGCVERFNKTLMHTIKKQNAVAAEWDDQVPFAVYAYNSVVHKTTGDSPMFLMYGRDAKGGLEKIGDDACGVSYVDMDEYKNLLVQELNKAYAFVKEHALQEQQEHKVLFDAKHRISQKSYPQPGARVLVEIPSEKMGARYPKLTNKWRGPYRVIACSENSATLIPVAGSDREILKVPFENLRNIPQQMDNTPVETKKGRARLRHTFKHKDLKRDDVTMLVQKRLPMFPEMPTDDAWGILGQCPTLSLWVKDIVSWKDAFDLQYAMTLEKCLGTELLQSMSSMVFCFPGVELKSVALALKHVKLLKDEDTVAERIRKNLETTEVNVAVFVIPFSTSEQSKDSWQEAIHAVPKEIDVIVVFSHVTQFDHAKGETFTQLVKELYRLDGKINVLGPDFIVTFNLNRTLLNVSDRSNCLKYWEDLVRKAVARPAAAGRALLVRIVKEEKIIWPHLKLATLEPVETNQSAATEATGASGSGFGPIRAHNSRGSRSGSYGLGSYSKFRHNR